MGESPSSLAHAAAQTEQLPQKQPDASPIDDRSPNSEKFKPMAISTDLRRNTDNSNTHFSIVGLDQSIEADSKTSQELAQAQDGETGEATVPKSNSNLNSIREEEIDMLASKFS